MIKKLSLYLFLVLASHLFAKEPDCLYLTWLRDPSTTMVIQWHAPKDQSLASVLYHKIGESSWKQSKGRIRALSQFAVDVFTVELDKLEPASDYVFRIRGEKEEYKFRTMPSESSQPVKFVVAGDAYFYLYLYKKMNAQIAKTDPDFVVVGGDIAYTNNHAKLFQGKDWEIRRWGTFFNEWKKSMVTSDGRLIPMLAVIGNHDIKKSSAVEVGEPPKKPQPVPLFFDLFAMPEKGLAYRVLDFGNYLSLFLLDSGHVSPMGKEQRQWLENQLDARTHIQNKMAAYHISAYPSVYKYESAGAVKVRKYWVPLFEKYRVLTAFEHHNHAYKRTHRIKEGKIDPNGVMYLGDGAWGVPARKPRTPKKSWYLAKSAQKNCFWQVTIEDGECFYKSFDIEGKVIEDLALLVETASKAD